MQASAVENTTKGIISDFKKEDNTLQSELLITKTEQKAIETLQKILTKKKGTSEEPDLLYRLAELYVRKSKSGRFFDLQLKEGKLNSLTSFPVPLAKGSDSLKKAISIYNDLESRFPRYSDMDMVYFSRAFAHQQIGALKVAEENYLKLTQKYRQSNLLPDSYVALGELAFNSAKFGLASEYFSEAAKFTDSRVYSFALYKRAWSYYNLKNTDLAVKDLIQVVKTNPYSSEAIQVEDKRRQNLRKEAMRDLAIFASETVEPKEIYSFFKKIADKEELNECIDNVTQLFLGYSKWKDANTLLNEYLSEEKTNPLFVKIHLYQVQSYESQKKRDLVLSHLEEAFKLCRQEFQKEDLCQNKLRIEASELATKWWETWKRNQQNKEFSLLTEQILRQKIKYEDALNKDSKTRFALAELLFQNNKYIDAAKMYDETAELLISQKKTELRHESLYGAVYSIEKELEKNKNEKSILLQEQYSRKYLKFEPLGKYQKDLQLKLGIIEYERQNLNAALEWLLPLENEQAQDLVMDIYNKQQNLKALKIASEKNLALAKSNERKLMVQKINDETNFLILQTEMKNKEPNENAQLFESYAEKSQHPGLIESSLEIAISENFRSGSYLKASDMAVNFSKKFPKNKNTLKYLDEAKNTYLLNGQFEKAIDLIKLSSPIPWDVVADLYDMDGNHVQARKIFKEQKMEAKLQESLQKYGPESEWLTYKKSLIDKGIEPYTTEYLTTLAQEKLDKKNYEQAFDSAKKIIGRDVSSQLRAPARLIQAKILEQEFQSQSLKTSQESRLSLVLNIKLEKLEKAQTAYLSVIKMTTDSAVMDEAYLGIDRCYKGLIEGLQQMNAPESFNDEEKKAFKNELEALAKNISEKKSDNLKLISQRKGTYPSYSETLPPTIVKPKTLSPLPLKLMPNKQEYGWQAALYRAQEASQKGLKEKALFILKLGQKIDPKNPLIKYEISRQNLEEIDQALSTDLESKELDTFRGIRVFQERDYKKALQIFSRFRKDDQVELKLRTIMSEAALQDGNTDQAMEIIQGASSKELASKDGVQILLQQARILEGWKKDKNLALKKYEEVQKIAEDKELKQWLNGKIEFLKK